jgi:hypothetical protein
MSRRGARAGWTVGGLLLLGGAAVGIYFLFKRQGSSPSEWAPYLPTPSEPPMAPPIEYSTTQVDVLRGPGQPCTASSQCQDGYVCVNGTCISEAEWNA